MKLPVFLPAHHGLHRPHLDYSDGLPPVPHPECPERIEAALAGVRRAVTADLCAIERLAGDAELTTLHDPDYLACLEAIAASLAPDREYLPGLFREDLTQLPPEARGGMYCREIGTPIGPGSLRAARNSAAAALDAAAHLLDTGHTTLALCRPPGHHAGRRRYGGYCFFNNACLAARRLATDAPCAVLDLDYHLGDGSLEFAAPETPYFSLHADPWLAYPLLDADARLPAAHARLEHLPPDTTGTDWFAALDRLLEGIAASGAGRLVLSLGFDTLAGDDIQDIPLPLRVEDYGRAAARIRALGLPTLIVFEGGYDTGRLADCMQAFLTGWQRSTA